MREIHRRTRRKFSPEETIREPRAGPGVIDSVAAMSTALVRLAEEVAGVLRDWDAEPAERR